MPSLSVLVAFSAATLVLLVLPDPAVMYIVTRSVSQGRRAGLVSVAGVHVGTIVHVLAAMVGLSALLVASATAFTVVKLAGALYLVWLGVRALRSARRERADGVADIGPDTARPLGRIFADGVVLNVLNPKTAVFFLSFVPQFVDPVAPNPTLTLAVLGGVFIALGLVSDGAYALAGGWLGGRLTGSPRLRRRKDLVAGGTYLGLGLVTAVGADRP